MNDKNNENSQFKKLLNTKTKGIEKLGIIKKDKENHIQDVMESYNKEIIQFLFQKYRNVIKHKPFENASICIIENNVTD